AALGKLAKAHPTVVDPLLAVLEARTAPPELQSAVADALGEAMNPSGKVFEELLAALRADRAAPQVAGRKGREYRHPQVRESAAAALGNLGERNPEAFRDIKPKVLEALVGALREQPPPSPSPWPAVALDDLVVSRQLLIRASAATALGRLGQGNERVVE